MGGRRGLALPWCGAVTALLSVVPSGGAPEALSGAPAAGRPDTADETARDPVYLPAGVSDAEGAVGCLRTPAGGVEAVDLATGRSLWRSAAPSRALLVTREQAFVLEERAGKPLRLAVYAGRRKQLIRACDLATLDLPPWASLSGATEGREWTEFEVAARLLGEAIELRYDVTRRRVSGFVAPGVIARVQGAAGIRLDPCRLDRLPGQGPAPPQLTEPAAPPPGVRFLAAHVRAADATLVFGGPPPHVEGALVVGDRRFAFEMAPDASTVIVHRWRVPGNVREPPLRLEHARTTDAVWVTLDRRHVLLRRAHEQQWYDLYSLESGEPRGRLERPVDVAVVGPRVFWTTPGSGGSLAFIATDAASGRALWRRTVRDPEGPPGPPIP